MYNLIDRLKSAQVTGLFRQGNEMVLVSNKDIREACGIIEEGMWAHDAASKQYKTMESRLECLYKENAELKAAIESAKSALNFQPNGSGVCGDVI